jgi:hypothetical protein
MIDKRLSWICCTLIVSVIFFISAFEVGAVVGEGQSGGCKTMDCESFFGLGTAYDAVYGRFTGGLLNSEGYGMSMCFIGTDEPWEGRRCFKLKEKPFTYSTNAGPSGARRSAMDRVCPPATFPDGGSLTDLNGVECHIRLPFTTGSSTTDGSGACWTTDAQNDGFWDESESQCVECSAASKKTTSYGKSGQYVILYDKDNRHTNSDNMDGRNAEVFVESDSDLRDNWIGHDDISSIHVEPGCTVTVYKDVGHTGGSKTFDSSVDKLSTITGPCGGGKWNDCISSIKVSCTNPGQIYGKDGSNINPDRCESACGADAKCDDKSVGAACGNGGTCLSTCVCDEPVAPSCPLAGKSQCDSGYCTSECPCSSGGGDCNSNLGCEGSLICCMNVGDKNNYGCTDYIDICLSQTDCNALAPPITCTFNNVEYNVGDTRSCGAGDCAGTRTCESDGLWSACSSGIQPITSCTENCLDDVCFSSLNKFYDYPDSADGTCNINGYCIGYDCAYTSIDCDELGCTSSGCNECDYYSDPDGCDNTLKYCVSGACESCPSGWANCNQQFNCEADLSLDSHCGSCIEVCDPGETCTDGLCTSVCTEEDFCGNPSDNDDDNIADLYHRSTDCTETVKTYCAYGCTADRDSCNECDYNSDPDGCDNTLKYCVSGACESCPSGWANCDRTGTCEKNKNTDENNCGSCGNTCNQGQTCSSGVCETTTPQSSCDSFTCPTLSTGTNNVNIQVWETEYGNNMKNGNGCDITCSCPAGTEMNDITYNVDTESCCDYLEICGTQYKGTLKDNKDCNTPSAKFIFYSDHSISYNDNRGTEYLGAKITSINCAATIPECPPAGKSQCDSGYCTSECPCSSGGGDCNSDLGCEGSLICCMDVGDKNNYGCADYIDICLSQTDCNAATPTIECTNDDHCTDPKPKCDTTNNVCVECLQATDCKGIDGTYNTYCPKGTTVANHVLPICDTANRCQCTSTCGSGTGVNTQCASGYCCTGENPQGPNKILSGETTYTCEPKSTISNPWLCT